MDKLLRIASILDNSGHYKLADKIAQVVMNADQYYNNANTPKDIMKIRKQLVPSDFRGEMYQDKRGDSLMHTSNPQSFSIGLMEYARINKFPNLQVAFDNYSNAGATYHGKYIQTVPELRELYIRISRTNNKLSSSIIEQELHKIFNSSRNTNTPISTNNNQNNNIPNKPVNQTQSGGYSLNSNDPKSFAKNLLDFMESQNYERDKNLTKAFNDYADAGATYNGTNIKQIPALQKSYNLIAASRRFFNENEIEKLVDSSFKTDEAGPLIQRIYENAKYLPEDQRKGLMNAVRDSTEILNSYSPFSQ